MNGLVLRSLLTVCCLVLAMPPGWCSIVPAPVARDKEEPPKKTRGGCCDLCHCKDREKPSPEPKQPAPPFRCCCYELDWLKPNPPLTAQADLSLVAFVAPQDDIPIVAAAGYDLDLSIPVPSPPLDVLKCVWLC